MCAVSSPSGRSRTSFLASRTAIGPPARMSRTTDSARSPASSDNLGDEADPERVLRAEALARDEVAPRRGADLRQDERRDDRGDDPEPHLREAEHRVRPRDRDVGARDEPGAAAEREARGRSTRPARGTSRSPRASGRGASRPRRSRRRRARSRLAATRRRRRRRTQAPRPSRSTARASPTSANASASSAISAASKALRRSGRASVTRRTCPSRSTLSALTLAAA